DGKGVVGRVSERFAECAIHANCAFSWRCAASVPNINGSTDVASTLPGRAEMIGQDQTGRLCAANHCRCRKTID
ncbi:hypothetical protein, partial [Burkholderia vietnamiensis]|uniref:hypothetical protein n=1 Tax=Burkholderia vietnamiensis TaxID=60552 RepID=UPI001C87E072